MKGKLQTQNNNTADGALVTRPLFVTTLVSALAMGALGGCSSNGKSLFASKNTAPQDERAMAALATERIDPAQAQGQYDNGFYETQANEVLLPARWLSEATGSTALNQARRAAAQSAFVTLEANEDQALSAADSRLRGAMSEFETDQAHAERLQATFAARLTEMSVQADATEEANFARATRQGKLLDAAQLEWEGEFATLQSKATSEWEHAQQQHAQMLAARAGAYDRGNAEIDEMIKIADLTQSRANAMVADLRAQAQSVNESTAAEVASLNKRIETVSQTSSAEASELRERAHALRDASQSTVSELLAEATKLEQTGVSQQYKLDVQNAKGEFAKAEAKAANLFNTAEQIEQTTNAQVASIRSSAEEALEVSRAQWESEQVAIERFEEQGRAEVALRRAEANKVETQARAQFVKAEATARANAVREQAKHQAVLARDEFKKIKADAEAEASRIRAEYLKTFAAQVAAGNVTMPGFGKKAEEVSSSAAGPEFADAAEKPAFIEPDHVAQFKTALAEAAMIRKQADATEATLLTSVEERASRLSAWWSQQLASYDASTAEADALARWGEADVADKIAQAEGTLAKGRATLANGMTQADSNKQATLAKVASLRAEADRINAESTASVAQLLARAEAVQNNGKAEAERLAVQRDAAAQRGQAREKQLIAEARSLEQSQTAVVAQMKQDIDASRQLLMAEMAKLDAAAESFLSVAQANFNEQLTNAETHARFAEATKAEMLQSNEAERLAAQAQVAYLRQMTEANELIADAEVARAAADAEHQLAQFEAQDLMDRASIMTEARIAQASAETEFVIANAQDKATRAVFDARIAQTMAERNRAAANVYFADAEHNARTQQAVALAKAYEDMSNQALVQLNERQADFTETAQVNWNAALAMPTKFPSPVAADELYNFTNSTFFQPTFDPTTPNGSQTITSVPTDND